MQPKKRTAMMAVGMTHFVWEKCNRTAAARLGVPESYLKLILFLSRHPGAGQKEIAEFSHVSTAAVNQTVKEMLRKVAYAASQDDTRRTIKCVLMRFKDEKLTMVATDGRRLALVENEIEFPKSDERDIVLPSKAVAELQRTLSSDGLASVMLQKSQVCFNLGSVTIYSKIMEDAYPNYVQVIPKETAEHIAVDRQLLIDALERVSVMTIDEAHSTKLIFDSGKLTVSATASDIGDAKDEVPIKYAGETLEIVFNPSYLMDALKVIDDDEVTINLNDGHSPAVITCTIPFLYVLMPLRIS